MIEKFYTIQTNRDEANCFSVDEIYLRLIAAWLPIDKARVIRELASTMQPDDFFAFDDSKAGKIEIRCWKYYMG